MRHIINNTLLVLLFSSLVSCVTNARIDENKRTIDSLTRVSDSLTKYLDGFSYLKLGDTYKHISSAAQEHHKQYKKLFNSRVWCLSNWDTYHYEDGLVTWGEVQLSNLNDCNKFGRYYGYKDNPNIKELSGAMMFSETIIVTFDLLFFRDSLVRIDFPRSESFVKNAIEKKYGIGVVHSDVDQPGVKTDISKTWENDKVLAHYIYMVRWDPPHKNIKSITHDIYMVHKSLSDRMNADNKRQKDAEKIAKETELSDAMNSI